MEEDAAAQSASMFVFTASKAGMKDVDKRKVEQVVYDASKDSAYFHNSLKQNDRVDARIHEMQQRLETLTIGTRDRIQSKVDSQVVPKLEAERQLHRTIVMIDMDMFYAAVEMRDNPKLKHVPLAVGGIGMISTTNYIARKFGVRAAMPGFIGRKLCPDLVFVPVNMSKYSAIAKQIRAIFADFDPNFRPCSLDEACLDITDYMADQWRAYTTSSISQSQTEEHIEMDEMEAVPESVREEVASNIVQEIRKRIYDETQLTASAGIACNTMLAKVCSDMNKPNGQYLLPFTREAAVSFVQNLNVRKIGGIGKVMEKMLQALGITNGKELFDKRIEIHHVFSTKTAMWLLRTSLGLKEERESTARKSYSRERTFSGLSDPERLRRVCREICEKLATDMSTGRMGTKTITLKLKSIDFSVRSRALSFASACASADELYDKAVSLLDKELPLHLRLMGVRASALVSMDTDKGASKRQLDISAFADTEAADTSSKKPRIDKEAAREQDDFQPCPICSKLINTSNNIAINLHLDACIQPKRPVHKPGTLDGYLRPS